MVHVRKFKPQIDNILKQFLSSVLTFKPSALKNPAGTKKKLLPTSYRSINILYRFKVRMMCSHKGKCLCQNMSRVLLLNSEHLILTQGHGENDNIGQKHYFFCSFRKHQ